MPIVNILQFFYSYFMNMRRKRKRVLQVVIEIHRITNTPQACSFLKHALTVRTGYADKLCHTVNEFYVSMLRPSLVLLISSCIVSNALNTVIHILTRRQ